MKTTVVDDMKTINGQLVDMYSKMQILSTSLYLVVGGSLQNKLLPQDEPTANFFNYFNYQFGTFLKNFNHLIEFNVDGLEIDNTDHHKFMKSPVIYVLDTKGDIFDKQNRKYHKKLQTIMKRLRELNAFDFSVFIGQLLIISDRLLMLCLTDPLLDDDDYYKGILYKIDEVQKSRTVAE